jgi:cytochrome c oxidase subunit 1
MNPKMAMPFSLTTIIISVPFAIVIFSMIATLWRGSITFTCAMLWACGMLGEFPHRRHTGIINGSAAADIYVTIPTTIVGHFHYTLFPAVFYGMFAGFYYWWPKMFGRPSRRTPRHGPFLGDHLFFNMTFIPHAAPGHGRTPAPHLRPAPCSPITIPTSTCTWSPPSALYGLLFYQLPFVWAFVRGLPAGKTPPEPLARQHPEWLAPSPPVTAISIRRRTVIAAPTSSAIRTSPKISSPNGPRREPPRDHRQHHTRRR